MVPSTYIRGFQQDNFVFHIVLNYKNLTCQAVECNMELILHISAIWYIKFTKLRLNNTYKADVRSLYVDLTHPNVHTINCVSGLVVALHSVEAITSNGTFYDIPFEKDHTFFFPKKF